MLKFKYFNILWNFRIPTKKRTFWPVAQEELVKTIFRNQIAKRVCPTMAECLPVLHRFPHCQNQYRKLVEKVNNLITKGKGRRVTQHVQMNGVDDEDNDDDDDIEPARDDD